MKKFGRPPMSDVFWNEVTRSALLNIPNPVFVAWSRRMYVDSSAVMHHGSPDIVTAVFCHHVLKKILGALHRIGRILGKNDVWRHVGHENVFGPRSLLDRPVYNR